jgi:alpha-amylase
MPDGKSDCSLCTVNCDSCKSMPFEKAHDPSSTGYDTGKGKYTRVHRDAAIVKAMRNWIGLHEVDELVI